MKRTNDIVERYCIMMEVCRAVGLPFEEAIEMPDYELKALHCEILESRVPNHLGFKR